MKAAQINDYGDPTAIHIQETPTPTIKENHVLVEVYASSLNPFDSKLRSGAMRQMIPLTFPFTLGGDIAGVVTEVGAGVEGITVGDKVYGQANALTGASGALAEYALTPANTIAKLPKNLDFSAAASLPLAGVSALQALTSHINLQAGQKILITGGAGGIGTIAIQIAKYLGAIVVATANSQDADLLQRLGADEIIDYKTTDIASLPHDFDAVLNNAGPEEANQALSILKPGGVVVSLTGVDEAKAASLGVRAVSQMTTVTTEALNALSKLIGEAIVTPQITQIYPFEQIVHAFQTKESTHTTGKTVITIR